MVQALIPRILEGQEGTRAAQGIIAPGVVISTDVDGEVAIYEPPVLTLNIDLVPNSQPSRYQITAVNVVIGGRFDGAPTLHVIYGGTVLRAARLTAILDDATGAIASVTVTDGGDYLGIPTRVIAIPSLRTLTADVRVLGRGGRAHMLRRVPCALPVRTGDRVLVEIANGDARRGAYVSGLQVPRRPLILAAHNDPDPEQSDSEWRIGPRIPMRALGWQQGFVFEAAATVSLTWEGHDDADDNAPALSALDLAPRLEVRTPPSGDWEVREILGNYVARCDLSRTLAVGGGSTWTGDFHWAGVCAPSEALIRGGSAAVAFYVGAGLNTVKWARPLTHWLTAQEIRHGAYNPGVFWKQDASDLANVWQRTAPEDVTVTSYRLRVAEAGLGTW